MKFGLFTMLQTSGHVNKNNMSKAVKIFSKPSFGGPDSLVVVLNPWSQGDTQGISAGYGWKQRAADSEGVVYNI